MSVAPFPSGDDPVVEFRAWSRGGWLDGIVTSRHQSCNHSRYGLTCDDFHMLYRAEGGECGICGRPWRLGIDHHHGTGQVRGLLCGKCNWAMHQVDAGIDPEKFTRRDQMDQMRAYRDRREFWWRPETIKTWDAGRPRR